VVEKTRIVPPERMISNNEEAHWLKNRRRGATCFRPAHRGPGICLNAISLVAARLSIENDFHSASRLTVAGRLEEPIESAAKSCPPPPAPRHADSLHVWRLGGGTNRALDAAAKLIAAAIDANPLVTLYYKNSQTR